MILLLFVMWFLYLDGMSGSDTLIRDSLYLLSNISRPRSSSLISAVYDALVCLKESEGSTHTDESKRRKDL